MLDLGELNLCPLCDANLLGGRGLLSGLSSVSSSVECEQWMCCTEYRVGEAELREGMVEL